MRRNCDAAAVADKFTEKINQHFLRTGKVLSLRVDDQEVHCGRQHRRRIGTVEVNIQNLRDVATIRTSASGRPDKEYGLPWVRQQLDHQPSGLHRQAAGTASSRVRAFTFPPRFLSLGAMTNLLCLIKRWLARLILRGVVMKLWMRRKVSRLEARYHKALLANPAKRVASSPVAGPELGTPLRRVLFIADVQWELRELAPELQKICELKVLDLHPFLQRVADNTPLPNAVITAVSKLSASLEMHDPDAILLYLRPALLSDEVFHFVRKRWRCPLIGMNLDDKIEFLDYGVFSSGNDDYQRWARQFDMNLSNVRAVVDWYRDRNVPVMYLPEGYHPKVDGPPKSVDEFRHEFSFVGRRRIEREIFLRRLREMGVPIRAVGYGWPESEGGSNPEAVYRSTMLNLGIGFAAPSETLTTLKTRDFECPGSGACYLTTFNWELALHFDIGREILCYRSESEVVELFGFYRRHPEECLRIAKAAWRRCVAEHTWEQRFRKVFEQIGFKL